MNKYTLSGVAFLVAVLLGTWVVWQWTFCRFYVGPDQMAVVTSKGGKPLPPGRILAQKGQRGVQEEVLTEGRHFLNPVMYEYEIVPAITIPPGKVGIVTSKDGAPLPPGEFLAERGQQGVWKQALGPGKYRLNPKGYEVRVVDALSIPIGYVGVVTSLSGKQPAAGEFAKLGEKGVRADVLQPGLYYVNPVQFKVDVVEVGVNQVTLLGKSGGGVITKSKILTSNAAMDQLQGNVLQQQLIQRDAYFQESNTGMLNQTVAVPQNRTEKRMDKSGAKDKRKPAYKKTYRPQENEEEVEEDAQEDVAKEIVAPVPTAQAAFVLNQFVGFPSKDGFEISLDMTVEFELLPQNIAWLFRNYGDLPAAVDKVIMPQILSISRLKGSAYGAKDFIVGEGRAKFQSDLTDTLAKTLEEKKIIVHNALIRHVNVPMQILDPIQQASIAQEQDLTNQEKQNTAKKQAELNTELSLVDQAGQQVAQETEKLKASIKAEQSKQVAEIGGNTLKQVAEIEKATAIVRAGKVTTLGKAAAEVIRLVEGEQANGYQLKIKAFGDPAAYNLWTLADTLNEEVTVNLLHSGPGTLWTDLKKATMGELGGAKLLEKE